MMLLKTTLNLTGGKIFNFNIYRNSFERNNITYGKYLSKKNYNEKMAWDNIDIWLSKEFWKRK